MHRRRRGRALDRRPAVEEWFGPLFRQETVPVSSLGVDRIGRIGRIGKATASPRPGRPRCGRTACGPHHRSQRPPGRVPDAGRGAPALGRPGDAASPDLGDGRGQGMRDRVVFPGAGRQAGGAAIFSAAGQGPADVRELRNAAVRQGECFARKDWRARSVMADRGLVRRLHRAETVFGRCRGGRLPPPAWPRVSRRRSRRSAPPPPRRSSPRPRRSAARSVRPCRSPGRAGRQ